MKILGCRSSLGEDLPSWLWKCGTFYSNIDVKVSSFLIYIQSQLESLSKRLFCGPQAPYPAWLFAKHLSCARTHLHLQSWPVGSICHDLTVYELISASTAQWKCWSERLRQLLTRCKVKANQSHTTHRCKSIVIPGNLSWMSSKTMTIILGYNRFNSRPMSPDIFAIVRWCF